MSTRQECASVKTNQCTSCSHMQREPDSQTGIAMLLSCLSVYDVHESLYFGQCIQRQLCDTCGKRKTILMYPQACDQATLNCCNWLNMDAKVNNRRSGHFMVQTKTKEDVDLDHLSMAILDHFANNVVKWTQACIFP